jgi:hypothetical protein
MDTPFRPPVGKARLREGRRELAKPSRKEAPKRKGERGSHRALTWSEGTRYGPFETTCNRNAPCLRPARTARRRSRANLSATLFLRHHRPQTDWHMRGVECWGPEEAHALCALLVVGVRDLPSNSQGGG